MSVGYRVDDRIAHLTLDRGEKHNALRDSDIAALTAALRRFDRDDQALVAVLSGKGPSFSSGGDVHDRLQRSVDEQGHGERTHEADAFTLCESYKPVIAAVHGYCLGHALGTALLCDLLVASSDARFQVTETRIGFPAPGFLFSLGAPAFAAEATLTGRMMTAEDGYRAGFVTRVVAEREHVRAAEELAREVMANPQSAVREVVRVRRSLLREQQARLQSVAGGFRWTDSEDARRAIAARRG